MIFRFFLKKKFNAFLIILDSLIYFFTLIIPGKLIIDLIIKRPWKKDIFLKLLKPFRSQINNSIKFYLFKRSCKKYFATSCLSQSILGRIILDLLGKPNSIHLGMSKFANGEKIAHAWLEDLTTKEELISGIEGENSIFFTTL